MRAIRWISAALLALAAVSSGARAEGVLGMPVVPGGFDLAAYGARPCTAPAYGTYGSVVPGTYDCPSCCLNVWGGFCQKQAMHYQKLANKGCAVCTGETPCVKQGCGTTCGCRECVVPSVSPSDPAPSSPTVAQPTPSAPVPAMP
jgi:hypothetical protein